MGCWERRIRVFSSVKFAKRVAPFVLITPDRFATTVRWCRETRGSRCRRGGFGSFTADAARLVAATIPRNLCAIVAQLSDGAGEPGRINRCGRGNTVPGGCLVSRAKDSFARRRSNRDIPAYILAFDIYCTRLIRGILAGADD